MDNDSLEIKTDVGTISKVFEDAYSVRVKVFVDEQHIPIANERDEFDDTAYHCVVYIGDIPVSCGRLSLNKGSAKICRVATIKQFRGNGYASKVCKTLIELAKRENPQSIFLNAQITAMGMYKKLGFIAEGDVFYEENIEHIKMVFSEDSPYC